MTARLAQIPHADNYAKPVGPLSRHTGRPVATRADGKPCWLNRASSAPAESNSASVVEARAGGECQHG